MKLNLEITTFPERTNVSWNMDSTANGLEALAMLIIARDKLNKEIEKRLL